MKKRNKMAGSGEKVEGYTIPVLNEREIRASAGILFLFMFISLMLVLFKGNFLMIKYVLIVFLSDLVIRVFVHPRFSPALILGRLIVSRQAPEYVGAAQKIFAWKIGIGLAGLMFFLLVILNLYGFITGVSCLICLSFLFFESAFGICLGCLVYNLFYKRKAQYCAGQICGAKTKQEVQRISPAQLFILVGLIAFIVLLVFLFNGFLSVSPRSL